MNNNTGLRIVSPKALFGRRWNDRNAIKGFGIGGCNTTTLDMCVVVKEVGVNACTIVMMICKDIIHSKMLLTTVLVLQRDCIIVRSTYLY